MDEMPYFDLPICVRSASLCSIVTTTSNPVTDAPAPPPPPSPPPPSPNPPPPALPNPLEPRTCSATSLDLQTCLHLAVAARLTGKAGLWSVSVDCTTHMSWSGCGQGRLRRRQCKRYARWSVQTS